MKNRIKNRIHKNHATALLAALAMTVAATAFAETPGSSIIDIKTVTVGNINNAADTRYEGPGYGSVSYEYQIGKYEVTNAQYVTFLNAVVGEGPDTYSLYNSTMSSSTNGGITRNSSNVFEVKTTDWANKPVSYVSFYDAARFTNWLTTGSTETGLYTFTDGILTSTPDHATSTGWAIASENEWYKAAYYNPELNEGAGGYTDYPWAGGGLPSHEQGAVNGANYAGGGGIQNVGYYTNAISYFGTYDQAGNMWEWNDTIYPENNYVSRGGSFNYVDVNLGAASYRLNGPAYETNSIGIRVVYLTAVPEPGTWGSAMGLTMLVIGMWVRRGRRP
ncbi:MAG: formylglycine-generating enzyme family protein [Opitutaceae bacterium]|jgi:formylglycine-generating enzyme required for sulfatase activity|nr:formylglycine-generating enzyme family protein [Opitutaceae bacterium]